MSSSNFTRCRDFNEEKHCDNNLNCIWKKYPDDGNYKCIYNDTYEEQLIYPITDLDNIIKNYLKGSIADLYPTFPYQLFIYLQNTPIPFYDENDNKNNDENYDNESNDDESNENENDEYTKNIRELLDKFRKFPQYTDIIDEALHIISNHPDIRYEIHVKSELLQYVLEVGNIQWIDMVLSLTDFGDDDFCYALNRQARVGNLELFKFLSDIIITRLLNDINESEKEKYYEDILRNEVSEISEIFRSPLSEAAIYGHLNIIKYITINLRQYMTDRDYFNGVEDARWVDYVRQDNIIREEIILYLDELLQKKTKPYPHSLLSFRYYL
jgi:hypothetical protein